MSEERQTPEGWAESQISFTPGEVEAFTRAVLDRDDGANRRWQALIIRNSQLATTPPDNEMTDAPPPANPRIPLLTFGVETADRRRARWSLQKRQGWTTKAIRPIDFDAEKFWGKDSIRSRGEVRRIALQPMHYTSFCLGGDPFTEDVWIAQFTTLFVHPMDRADVLRCPACG